MFVWLREWGVYAHVPLNNYNHTALVKVWTGSYSRISEDLMLSPEAKRALRILTLPAQQNLIIDKSNTGRARIRDHFDIVLVADCACTNMLAVIHAIAIDC